MRVQPKEAQSPKSPEGSMHAEQSLLSIKMSATPQVSKSVQTSSLIVR